jgi:hypothetical protein
MGTALGRLRKVLMSDALLLVVVGLGGALSVAAQAQSYPEVLPCPTSQLAPFGIAPTPVHCINPDKSPNGCLVSFKNYQWWTSYVYNPSGGYYYNHGLQTIFAPEHAFVDAQGLHLVANNDIDLGGGKVWSGAEAVLMFDSDTNEVNLGYGDYLVTANSPAGTFWNTMDPNIAVGMFTYERYGSSPFPTFGGPDNPNREIDLAEISRWGWDHNPNNDPNDTCPYIPLKNNGEFIQRVLCGGSAQFATQLVPKSEISVQRYDTGSNISQITLVMQWRHDKVTFLKFNGAYTLDTLPTPGTGETWTKKGEVRKGTQPVYTDNSFKVPTPDELARFIPNPKEVKPNPKDTPTKPPQSCARFHLNLWFGNFPMAVNEVNPPPTSRQEVIITNFEYKPS